MTDTPSPATMKVNHGKPPPWRNISMVWLFPLLALAVTLFIAWRSYSDQGELIHIEFENASGVAAGETTLRYRDVVIGTVDAVNFSSDLSKVIVSARVEKAVAPFMDAESQFWVVRPEVTAEGVSGLSTVLSGVYIEGNWDGTPGEKQTRFTGLESRPLIDNNEKGTRVTLRTADGNIMSAGSPVFYRGVQVGRTESPQLSENGSVVTVDAFIESPHDRYLTTATRFWDTSGFQVSFGADGLKLDVGSFAALISGGIAFNTFFSGGEAIEPGQDYELYPDEATARENAFARVSTNTVRMSTVFEDGVSGLAPGASVLYEGLKIGEIETIAAFMNDTGRDLQVQQMVTLRIDPQLMGLDAEATADDVYDFIGSAVANGVRARLQRANLLSSSLIVELVEIEDVGEAALDLDAEPFPKIPSVPTDFQDINATLEGVMKRVNSLKIEELIAQATNTLASIQAVASDEATRAVPEQITALLGDARNFIGGEDTQAIPGELRGTIEELRSTVAEINRQGAIAQLVQTLENADATLASVTATSDSLPLLIEDLRALSAKVQGLPADEVMNAATGFLDSADRLIDTEQARNLPSSVSAALDEVRTILADLREGGAVENANSALASAQGAAESLETATADLPALTQRLDALLARSERLIAAYGDRSDFNRETLTMLREISAAARTVNSLAREIERSPNSLLFGK